MILRLRLFILLLLVSIVSTDQVSAAACRDLFQAKTPVSEIDFLEQSRNTKKAIEFLNKLDTEQHPQTEDPKLSEILRKTIEGPKDSLSEAELNYLAADPLRLKIHQATRVLTNHSQQVGKLTQRTLEYWQGKAFPIQVTKEKTWTGAARRSVQSFYNNIVRFLVPVVQLPRWNSQVDVIFEKQYKNADYQPTPEEHALLKTYNAVGAFEQKANFIKTKPGWAKFRRWVSGVFLATIMVNGVFVSNWANHLSGPNSIVAAKEFLVSADFRLAPNQVRLYNETVPFPHLAIEIGEKVYSYGQTHMSIQSVTEYLSSDKIAQAAQIGQNQNNEGSSSLAKISSKIGLDNISRSVQMVTLNLSKEQIAGLQRSLEMSMGKTYRNQTLAMDCATMIMLALGKHADVHLPGIQGTGLTFDAAPSVVMMYMGILKTLGTKNSQGHSLVGDIRQVDMGSEFNKNSTLARSLYINALEGRTFISFFPFNFVNRTYLHARYGQENFQFLDPQFKKELEDWQRIVTTEFQEGNTAKDEILLNFIDRARSLGQTPQNQRNGEWKSTYDQLLRLTHEHLAAEHKENLRTLSASDISFPELIRTTFRSDLIRALSVYIPELAQKGEARLELTNAKSIVDNFLESNGR